VPPIVREVLGSPGRALDPADRTLMESRFGHDFSRVQVHTDARAAESARSINATAYAFGQSIVFGAGQYRPHSPSGRYVLAHELTHLVQQGPGSLSSTPASDDLILGDPSDRFEQEADRVAAEVSRPSGEPSRIAPAHLRAVVGSERGDPDRYSTALQDFRREQDNGTLERYRSRLGEPNHRLAVTQASPLQQVRRFTRAPKESREDLETAPVTDEFVTDICTFFYPDLPAPTRINEPLRNLASAMLWEAIRASRAMDLVPRPTGAPPGVSWLARQAVQAAWRRGRDEGIYEAVRVTVAARFRSEYELAKEGIGF
jgi:hypothetical protein